MPSSGVQTCALDRKSTRLNSSHGSISYAVFCLKKHKQSQYQSTGQDLSCAHTHHGRSVRETWSSRRNVREAVDRARRDGLFSGLFFFFLLTGHPPNSPLFPNPPLSR